MKHPIKNFIKAFFLPSHAHRLLLIFLSAFSFFSFENPHKELLQDFVQFEESNYSLQSISISDEALKYEIRVAEQLLYLDIELETERSILSFNELSIPVDFNFFYDSELESALEEIKVLKASMSEDLVVVLPTFTEEFLAFQLIKFESNSKTYSTAFFEINTHQYPNVRSFYLNHTLQLKQRNENFEITIDDFSYEGSFSETNH